MNTPVTATPGTSTFGKTLHVYAGGSIDSSGNAVTYAITGDLLVDNGGVIEGDDDNVATPNTGASDITITVSGDADLAAGSRISADNLIQGGTGGDISITVAGDMILRGTAGTDNCRTFDGDQFQDAVYGVGSTPNVYDNPALGARISAIRFGASSSEAGGNITINVGSLTASPPPSGTFTMERCSLVDVSSRGSAGAIVITSGRTADVYGLVLSESSLSGTGTNQAPGGGPITVKTGCELTVSDTGFVSSKGQDPGADLVHLEGCEVLVQGVVRSTGVGHALPNSPPNHCNAPQYPYQHSLPSGASFTACVEIWGKNITIDASGAHNGNVNVDGIKTDTGGPRAGWINIFAANDVTILGDPVGSGVKWAVSADANGATNQYAGLIEIKARDGSVTTTGQAVSQANATGAGSDGGKTVIEAGGPNPAGDVNLDGSFIEATGPTAGTGPAGGTILVRSYHGDILGSAGGHIDAHGDGALNPGSVTLTECGAVNQYLGTISPAPTRNFNDCLGTLTLPANATAALLADSAIWEACNPAAFTISGAKHQDTLQGVGLPGWTIRLYDSGNALLASTVTGAGGTYSFGPVGADTYKVCEVLITGWTQTAPTTGPACTAADEAPIGITVTVGPDSTGNDFANTQLRCEKQPVQTVLDPTSGRFPGNKGPDVFVILSDGDSIQDAIDTVTDVNNDNYLLIQVLKDTTGQLGGSTNQRFTISQNYAKTFGLIGCSNTLNDPTPSLPTELIASTAGSPGNIFVMDVHGSGSSLAGVKVEGSGRELRNVYANSNSGVGYWLVGGNNVIHNGQASNNTGDGVYIGSNGNTMTDTDLFGNGGNGVNVVGSNNQLLKLDAGEKGKGNKGDGIHVVGSSNLVSEPGAFANGGDGIDVAGSLNTVSKAVAGDSGKGNTGDGIRILGTGNKLTENKASANKGNGLNIGGGTAGSPNVLTKNVSNTGSSGNSSLENTLKEYLLAGSVSNGTGNKADNTAVPAGGKCSGFPAPGSCE